MCFCTDFFEEGPAEGVARQPRLGVETLRALSQQRQTQSLQHVFLLHGWHLETQQRPRHTSGRRHRFRTHLAHALERENCRVDPRVRIQQACSARRGAASRRSPLHPSTKAEAASRARRLRPLHFSPICQYLGLRANLVLFTTRFALRKVKTVIEDSQHGQGLVTWESTFFRVFSETQLKLSKRGCFCCRN